VGVCVIKDHDIGTLKPLLKLVSLLNSTNQSFITMNILVVLSTMLYLREPCKAHDSICLLFPLHIL
jgi:hypothetical protein